MPDVLLDEIALKKLTHCPKCGENWEDINFALYAGTGRQYRGAVRRIHECDICAYRFGRVDFEMIEGG
jgi:hypothetical protein